MKTTVDVKDILVRTLPTPNPYALKFVVNLPLKREGKSTFHAAAECGSLPLVHDLFSIPGVKQVYLFQNTVTITHSGELPESALGDQVEMVLKTRLPIHDPDFPDAQAVTPKARPDRSSADPLIQQIEEILDRTVRPGLQADGGDIEIVDFSNDDLKILYQGACGGCPSAMMGTLDAIQGILRSELNNEKITVTPIAS